MSHSTDDRILTEEMVGSDPFVFFDKWYRDAESAHMVEPAAMALATASPAGIPSVRIVLLRGFDGRGFTFFTNYDSRKGKELEANPQAALTIYWAELERQVRIEGSVAKVSTEESDAYFRGRPFGHRLSAHVSEQSQIVPSREALEHQLQQLAKQYTNQDVPRPEHWGGFRVTPHTIEFWQGRLNRLHDRLRFRRQLDDSWLRERLAP